MDPLGLLDDFMPSVPQPVHRSDRQYDTSQAVAMSDLSELQHSAAIRCLHEPAILHCILQELPQQDLLLVQRVNRTWRTTITSSKSLLMMLYLRPGTSNQKTPPETSTLNPLLIKHFSVFFQGEVNFNHYSLGRSNIGPWLGTSMLHRPLQRPTVAPAPIESYLRPEASWRKMLPCLPAPAGLKLHIGDGDGGVTKSLKFDSGESNRNGSWLTFGVIYDLIEEAWFSDVPPKICMVMVDFNSNGSGSHTKSIPPWAIKNHQSRELGYVHVNLYPDRRSDKEIIKARESAVARRSKSKPLLSFCGTRPPNDPLDKVVFTDQFHIQGALGVDDVEWDEVKEYGIPGHLDEEDEGKTSLRFWKR